VADGHGTVAPDLPPDTITRIIKFTPDGKFIKVGFPENPNGELPAN
jgi:hypothetical protein